MAKCVLQEIARVNKQHPRQRRAGTAYYGGTILGWWRQIRNHPSSTVLKVALLLIPPIVQPSCRYPDSTWYARREEAGLS